MMKKKKHRNLTPVSRRKAPRGARKDREHEYRSRPPHPPDVDTRYIDGT